MRTKTAIPVLAVALASAMTLSAAAQYPDPKPEDYILREFKFNSGETLPELRMHYETIGQPVRNAQGVVQNAVLILHGTTGSVANFRGPTWADELYGPGQPLDASKYYLIVVDNVGHGQSSKPSDGLYAKFPQYGYRDMIEAQYRLLTEGLDVNHLRLVIGTSMGGMHAWLWGSIHPDFMDALMPLASLPTQISGRNRMWRRIVIDAVRYSPDWNDGDYRTQPSGLRTVAQMMYLMGENPVRRLQQAPTLAEADRQLNRAVDRYLNRPSFDANDVMYAFAASRDYDPGPGLEKIKAHLTAINFADDLINPPEQGVLMQEIKRVPHGKAVIYPLSEETVGHGTHTRAKVWKEHLEQLLKDSAGWAGFR